MPSIPMRETCHMCHRLSPVGFHVPNDMWKEVIHPYYVNDVVCLTCFITRADEKLISWDEVIELFPVSKVTHLKNCGTIRIAQDLLPKAEGEDGSQHAKGSE